MELPQRAELSAMPFHQGHYNGTVLWDNWILGVFDLFYGDVEIVLVTTVAYLIIRKCVGDNTYTYRKWLRSALITCQIARHRSRAASGDIGKYNFGSG